MARATRINPPLRNQRTAFVIGLRVSPSCSSADIGYTGGSGEATVLAGVSAFVLWLGTIIGMNEGNGEMLGDGRTVGEGDATRVGEGNNVGLGLTVTLGVGVTETGRGAGVVCFTIVF